MSCPSEVNNEAFLYLRRPSQDFPQTVVSEPARRSNVHRGHPKSNCWVYVPSEHRSTVSQEVPMMAMYRYRGATFLPTGDKTGLL